MKTIFTQNEIQQALLNYAAAQGVVTEGRDISVTFNRGRGEGNLTAELDIADPNNYFKNRKLSAVVEPEEVETVTEAVINNPVNPDPAPAGELVGTADSLPEPIKEEVKEDPPFVPDEPKEPEVEAQTGNSVPSSDALPKSLFGPN